MRAVDSARSTYLLPRLATLLHAVPPGADAGHEIVIAREHLDRLALAVLGGLDAEPARVLLLFRRHPAPLVPPQARTEFALERPPGAVVDQLAAPAVLDQKARRVPGVERGDVIAGMAAERDADALRLAEREIVALAHIVEAVELHHHVMDHVDAALDEGDAVMTRIDVEEIAGERAQPIVAELELEDVLIERHHLGDALEMHHHVAHTERTGAEAGNVAAGLERIGGGLRAVEDFEPVAAGIVEHDQVLDVALAGERARAARNLGTGRLDARRHGVKRGGVGDLPAEEADALPAVGVDHEALLAIVHAEGETRAALVDALQAEEVLAVARPVADVLGANSDIAQRFDAHDHPRSLRSGTGSGARGPKNRPLRTKPPAGRGAWDAFVRTGTRRSSQQAADVVGAERRSEHSKECFPRGSIGTVRPYCVLPSSR